MLMHFCLYLLLSPFVGSNTISQMYSKVLELQTQLSLRETEHEHLDSKLDTILREIRKLSFGTQDNSIEDRLKQLETNIAKVVPAQADLKNDTKYLAERFAMAKTDTHTVGGSVYTRWGRTCCPGNGSAALYAGYAAGTWFSHTGGSPNMLCLPKDPEWGKYVAEENSAGNYIYGVEYQTDNGRDTFLFGKQLFQQDVPCVVCDVQHRMRKLMIPGRKTCYDGWTKEYWGYLMSGHHTNKAQADYHCVDSDPEVLPDGHENKNGYLLYFVEVGCGSLKCPPYVKGRELSCVVCTK